jgi:iron complex outermembrane receptor protein
MRITLFVIAIFLCSFCSAQQQTGSATVTILGETKNPIEGATVQLLKNKDSTLIRSAISDKNGNVEISNIPPGNYFFKINAVNYQQFSTRSFLISAAQPISAGKVTMQIKTTALKEVSVVTKKPFIQKLSDRIVVNVENSIISAGSSAMDVLERSPGVTISQDDVISLRGKSGVIIMIDGKPSPMTGTDLANYLKGLPSSAIDHIDIITNPSAKYEAAGNSGIIDIHMKKDQRMGANGTFSTGYGQGVYPKANIGSTFNYRNKTINIFGNYNYAYRVGLNHLLLDRNFYDNGIYKGGDLKDNYSKSPVSSNTARIGLDYFPNRKTIIGFVLNTNFNHYTRNNDNNSLVLDPQRQPVNTFNSFATNNDHSNNSFANINFKHTFDSTGKEITADADYGVYNSNSITVNNTKYYTLNGTSLQPDYTLKGDQQGKLTLQTAKIDYVNPFSKSGKLEAGLKTSYVSADNDAKFFDISSGTPVNDINKTNHFFYKEYNNAAYINISKTYKKYDIQLGLRGEQTNISTEQKINNAKFDSSYFQLFPSAFANYKFKEDNILGISVSRRINRPGYSQLNPFLFLIDVSTYATGRPGLLPELTWSYELSYTLKSLNFSVNYSHTKDPENVTLARFKEVFPNIPSSENVTVQIPINLGSSDYIGLSISAPIQIKKWWNVLNNADMYYQNFKGSFSGTVLNSGKPVADIRSNNTFTFKKGWTAELNATLNTGGQYGFMVLDPQWSLSSGVQKLIMKNKGTIRFNITDIFWTNLPKAVVIYNNYIERWHAYRESRVANITFTYRFGNNKVMSARKRTTASEEERQRAGGN